MRTLRTYLPAAALSAAGLVLIALFFFPSNQAKQPVPPVPVQVWASGAQVSVQSSDRIPANLLVQAGLRLFPGDRLLLGGREISPYTALTTSSALLQVITGTPVTLTEGANQRTFSSSAATLGEALWQAGVRWDPSDRLDPAPETPLDHPLQVTLRRAIPLTITQGDRTLKLRSAATRVGEALAEAGLSLQGLDTTQPAESQPVPADGRIHVVRVQEQVLLEQKTIPFKSQYQADPQTELDQRSVLQPGVTGLIVARVRVRKEDGKEVSRQKEAEWTAREPKDQLVGYGTKVVVHSESVDGVTIQYWRKLNVYATSY
ncbi:MAG: G5 domain-containing protein, partial [Anaerolineaceae bacterium]|nr:G5 domain-containing protein [Anaerolineaceae bacterium]